MSRLFGREEELRRTGALLEAEGRTNAEVASQLFVTRKTIEHHLSRVYRKLGLRGPTELARALASETAPAVGMSRRVVATKPRSAKRSAAIRRLDGDPAAEFPASSDTFGSPALVRLGTIA